jgi:hypothetical protein
VAVLHEVADGVTVLVTVPVPEYARVSEDSAPLQTLAVTSLWTSVESSYKPGDETFMAEPEARVTVKLVGLTVMDWMTALEPEMLMV